jgi:uncharacterized protein YjbJ (UPF0337 family)
MDWDRIEGSWKQFRGQAQSQWGALTDDELTRIGGRHAHLVGKLQELYGYSRDRAHQEVDRWAADLPRAMGSGHENFAAGVLGVIGNVNSAVQVSLKHRPRETLAIAAVAGFLLGILWRS